MVRACAIGGAELLVVHLDAPPAVVRQLAACLDPAEHLRADRFARAADARRFVVAHGVLRRELAARLCVAPASLTFTVGWRGKPRVAGRAAPLHFSLSHAGDVALIAISEVGPVGVDLELAGTAPAADLEAWVRREAFAKATGAGIVSGDRLSRRGWTIHTFEPVPGSAAALAFRS